MSDLGVYLVGFVFEVVPVVIFSVAVASAGVCQMCKELIAFPFEAPAPCGSSSLRSASIMMGSHIVVLVPFLEEVHQNPEVYKECISVQLTQALRRWRRYALPAR